MFPQDQSIGRKVLVVDYEIAIHQAFKQIFTDGRIAGCLFHFKQCLRNTSDRFLIYIYTCNYCDVFKQFDLVNVGLKLLVYNFATI